VPERTSQTRPQRQRQRGLILEAWNDTGMSTASNYLVKGILPRTGLAVVWGPPKCGKSFSTFDLVVHIALGREYRGRKVQQGVVVYCALEGGGGFGNRIEAWRKQHGNGGEDNVPFYLIRQPFDLVNDYTLLIAAIRDELGKAAPAAIVIDTLNRAMGGGDENKSDDMGKFIKALGAVQAAFDCLIVVVHHCGIVGTRPRGHTSLAGADDAQIRIERNKDGIIKATVEHAKDFEAGAVLASKLEQVELGIDSDRDAISSCVITASEGDSGGAGPKLSKSERFAFELLQRLIASPQDSVVAPAEAGLPAGTRVCLADTWRKRFYQEYPAEKQDTKKKALLRATLELTSTDIRLIVLWQEYVWLAEQERDKRDKSAS
jgi:AAA domain